MSTGPENASFALPFANISKDYASRVEKGATASVCVRDLYTKKDHGPIDTRTHNLEAELPPHDSAFFCVRPAVDGGCNSFGGCPSFAA